VVDNKRVPYTAFGVTKLVPLNVYVDCKKSTQAWFQTSVWIERGEDYYGIRKEPTLVVERSEWLRSPEVKNGG
jgi:hypothetical protein